MNLHFEYSFELEKNRIIQHYSDRVWLQEHGYASPSMPGKLNVFSSTKEELLSALENEYDEINYIEFVQNCRPEIESRVFAFENFMRIHFENMPRDFIIRISRFGLGSYFEPNIIEINICKDSLQKIIYVIFHEMVHLCIEKDIQIYGLKHWEKERIVDLIVLSSNIFTTSFSYESYAGVEAYIDPLFNDLFFKSKEAFFLAVKTRL